MIGPTEVLSQFQQMLAAAGFDVSRPDPVLAWRIFKDFSAIPVDAATDGLLFQCGTFTFTGAPQFEFDFTRQFTHASSDVDDVGHDASEDSDDDADLESADQVMEQLACTFHYAPTETLDALNTNLWSFDFATREDFFAAVEALPEFRTVMTGPPPSRVVVSQEHV